MSTNSYVRSYLSLIVGIAMLAVGAPISAGKGSDTHEVFTASAISLGGPQPATVGRISFSIDRWTTADDDKKLQLALRDGRSKDVVEALQDLKSVGRISTPGSIGYPLQYAAQDMLPDGSRHIILMTDRPMSFAEVWDQPITVDYPVTYIELKVDKDGKGSGKMMIASKLTQTRKLLVVEDWAVQPIQLNDVKKQS
jgi:hypothetical protein